jgi:hypothetical protein
VAGIATEWDPDGWPKWLVLKLHGWKGKQSEQAAQRIRYYRNYCNTAYCPVIGIVMWLLNSGLGAEAAAMKVRCFQPPCHRATVRSNHTTHPL